MRCSRTQTTIKTTAPQTGQAVSKRARAVHGGALRTVLLLAFLVLSMESLRQGRLLPDDTRSCSASMGPVSSRLFALLAAAHGPQAPMEHALLVW